MARSFARNCSRKSREPADAAPMMRPPLWSVAQYIVALAVAADRTSAAIPLRRNPRVVRAIGHWPAIQPGRRRAIVGHCDGYRGGGYTAGPPRSGGGYIPGPPRASDATGPASAGPVFHFLIIKFFRVAGRGRVPAVSASGHRVHAGPSPSRPAAVKTTAPTALRSLAGRTESRRRRTS
jgi:hypothetical protein